MGISKCMEKGVKGGREPVLPVLLLHALLLIAEWEDEHNLPCLNKKNTLGRFYIEDVYRPQSDCLTDLNWNHNVAP